VVRRLYRNHKFTRDVSDALAEKYSSKYFEIFTSPEYKVIDDTPDDMYYTRYL